MNTESIPTTDANNADNTEHGPSSNEIKDNNWQPDIIGVVLCNLGTPTAATPKEVARYLNAFLSDPRVVELPKLLWQPVLKGIVSPRRSKEVALKYETIWMDGGSPLLVYTKAQALALQERFAGRPIIVDYAMRYGEPEISKVLHKLLDQGCEKILVMPMYPQYSASTTATLFDYVARFNARLRNQFELRMPKRYADHPAYIYSLYQHVKRFWQHNGKPEYLLLSYHGLPKKYIDEGDPYYQDCMQTSKLLKQALEGEGVEVKSSFQSLFGRSKWLKPSTQKTIIGLAEQGVRKLDVMCPGFSVDCLETLEEIAIVGKYDFLQHHGEQFRYISCLNAEPFWIEALQEIIESHLGGWEHA